MALLESAEAHRPTFLAPGGGEIRPLALSDEQKLAARELPCDHVFALVDADPPKGWIEKLGVAFVMREEEVVTW